MSITRAEKVFIALEQGFVIVTFLFLSGAITDLVNEGSAVSGARDPISRLMSYVIQIGTFALVILWRRRIIQTMSQNRLLWIFIGFVVASTAWSTVPATTFRNSTFILQISLFGTYIAARYSWKEQLKLLAWAFAIAIGLSFLCSVLLPSYGIMGRGAIVNFETINHAGSWRGIYIHKNVLGRIMVLSTMVFFIIASEKRINGYLWAGFVLSTALILLSTSKTSLIMMVTLVALIPLYKGLRWNCAVSLPFFISLILMGGSTALIFVNSAEMILKPMGKDLTLTGRTEIWSISLDKLSEQPWLGYGLTGFWRGWQGPSADIWEEFKWSVPHSHNGVMDLTLDLGLMGLVLFVALFVTTYVRAITRVRLTKTPEGLWPIAYLTFLFLANLTESTLLRQPAFWTLFVSVVLSTHHIPIPIQEPSNVRLSATRL
jgi:exopolysaccharide production protein ExoQ